MITYRKTIDKQNVLSCAGLAILVLLSFSLKVTVHSSGEYNLKVEAMVPHRLVSLA